MEADCQAIRGKLLLIRKIRGDYRPICLFTLTVPAFIGRVGISAWQHTVEEAQPGTMGTDKLVMPSLFPISYRIVS
ncbi:hypothetical protein B5F34_00945 [Mediterranea sp. An20]|nr:hypothetical protein B5F34_00945 [Mediterranea sp. An20]